MALLYKLYKNETEGSKMYNKYYARAYQTSTTDIDGLAEMVSYSTTATKADCKAVIEALVKARREALRKEVYGEN